MVVVVVVELAEETEEEVLSREGRADEDWSWVGGGGSTML